MSMCMAIKPPSGEKEDTCGSTDELVNTSAPIRRALSGPKCPGAPAHHSQPATFRRGHFQVRVPIGQNQGTRQRVTLALLPQVAPFPAAPVRATRSRALPIQKVPSHAKVLIGHGLLGRG